VADFRTATSVGARIAAARKMRGFKSTKDLAAAIPGESVTGSILQNIEAGRKNDLAVAQLLNIAAALKLSPLFILAPLGSPHERLDLPNISPAVAGMSVAEFDAWVSGLTSGSYRALSADEMSERTQLEAFRELLAARREQRHLELRPRIEEAKEWDRTPADQALLNDIQFRVGEVKRRIRQLEIYLGSAGWGVQSTPPDGGSQR
jgi:transcriptional regulator with XRE-family HTH domain